MMKQNVYISKSNEADSAILATLRIDLASYNTNILEYTPGERYDPRIIDSAKIVFVVPPKINELFIPEGTDDVCIFTGKGQGEEVSRAISKGLFCFVVVREKNYLGYHEIFEISDEQGDNWKFNTHEMFVASEGENLKEVMTSLEE